MTQISLDVEDPDVLHERIRHLEAILEVAHEVIHGFSQPVQITLQLMECSAWRYLCLLLCPDGEQNAEAERNLQRAIAKEEAKLARGEKRSVKR